MRTDSPVLQSAPRHAQHLTGCCDASPSSTHGRPWLSTSHRPSGSEGKGGKTPAANARRIGASHSSAAAAVRLEGPRRSARPEKGPYMVAPFSWACAQDAAAGCEKVTKAKPREWLVILSRMTCACRRHAVRSDGHCPGAPEISRQVKFGCSSAMRAKPAWDWQTDC